MTERSVVGCSANTSDFDYIVVEGRIGCYIVVAAAVVVDMESLFVSNFLGNRNSNSFIPTSRILETQNLT
jgi:hypothetical protein